MADGLDTRPGPRQLADAPAAGEPADAAGTGALSDLIETARAQAVAVEADTKRRERVSREREAAARRRERTVRWLILSAIVVVLAISAGAATIAIVVATGSSAEIAELTTSGEVASARASSAAAVRGDPNGLCTVDTLTLVCANRALLDAGLPPVVDPGPGASAYQLAAAVGEARGTLRALREVEARGVDLPGVNLPRGSAGGPFLDDADPAPR